MSILTRIYLRKMTADDLPFACSQTGVLGWGNTEDDFRRYLVLFPEGCFVAELDGERVGMITSAIFGKLGFLGNLIVLHDYRNHGIGRKLMDSGISYLQKSACRTIELVGDYPAVSLYRKLGFKDKYMAFRFFRKASGPARERIPESGIEISSLIEWDKKLVPIDRADYLRSVMNDNRDYIYSTPSGDGFGIIKSRASNFRQIGPVVANSTTAADRIIGKMSIDFPDLDISLGVGETNRAAVKLYLDHGFVYNPPSLRMYLGERIDFEDNIYAEISGDVG